MTHTLSGHQRKDCHCNVWGPDLQARRTRNRLVMKPKVKHSPLSLLPSSDWWLPSISANSTIVQLCQHFFLAAVLSSDYELNIWCLNIRRIFFLKSQNVCVYEVKALIKLQIKLHVNVKTRLLLHEQKPIRSQHAWHSLINLRKSIAGTFLPKQYYINIVLTHIGYQGQQGLQQPTSNTFYWVCHSEYITDTLGTEIHLLIVPQWHIWFFFYPLPLSWVSNYQPQLNSHTMKPMKYDSAPARGN